MIPSPASTKTTGPSTSTTAPTSKASISRSVFRREMGSKKRSSSSLEEEVESQRDAFVLNPLENKKMKKDNKVDGTLSVMPMERRKKRKALAKERRHAAVSENEKKAKEMDVESVGGEDNAPVVSSSSGGLPEFHIGVFKDLASADGKAREAAVEAMVRELWLEKLCAFFEVCSAQAYPWSFFIERDGRLGASHFS